MAVQCSLFNVASAFLFDINVVTRQLSVGERGGGGLAPARLSKEVARNDKLTERAQAHTKSSVKSSRISIIRGGLLQTQNKHFDLVIVSCQGVI